MKDVLEGVVMALLLIAALSAAYLLAVFLIAGANVETFIRILESLWSNRVWSNKICVLLCSVAGGYSIAASRLALTHSFLCTLHPYPLICT
jgi:hypothetical protein